MGAHPRAFESLAQRIREASSPEDIDVLLDQWWDIQHRATEWDADNWGFEPNKWMAKERFELNKRAFAPSDKKAEKTS